MFCAPDPESGRVPFNCEDCKEDQPLIHCGWIDESKWLPYQGPEYLGTHPHVVKLTVLDNGEPRDKVYCPGYLSRMPLVREAYHAFSARKDGLLGMYYPGKEMVILESTDAATVAVNRYEAAMNRKLRDKTSGG